LQIEKPETGHFGQVFFLLSLLERPQSRPPYCLNPGEHALNPEASDLEITTKDNLKKRWLYSRLPYLSAVVEGVIKNRAINEK
jgi:hypothetical protein